jgi:hypothetical protein
LNDADCAEQVGLQGEGIEAVHIAPWFDATKDNHYRLLGLLASGVAASSNPSLALETPKNTLNTVGFITHV